MLATATQEFACPVPLRRQQPARPSLDRITRPSAVLITKSKPSPGPVPAQAQESGEHRQLLDAAWYALDGLQPSVSEAMQCDSALTFAEMAATGRGRLALRWVQSIVGVFKLRRATLAGSQMRA